MAASALVYGERRRGRAASSPASSASTRTASPARTTSPAWSCSASTCCSPRACAARSSKQVIARYGLAEGREPQKYGLGMKELWEVDPAKHRLGQVTHTMGWPLGANAGGGSFIYHLENNQVYVGFVVHLNYENPWLYPYMEFQRFKHHPLIADAAEGRQARRLRRAGDHRGRLAVGAEAHVPGRRAARLLRPASSTCRGSRATTTRCSRASPPPRRRMPRSRPAGRATSSTAYAEAVAAGPIARGPQAGAQRQAALVALRADRLAGAGRARHVDQQPVRQPLAASAR